ncbi:MAG TPA: Rho termination factor N-terminal domain-containing protein, partial [Myxococcales bacterium]|nr:Rho termination factor N-terminal domain-containing protein [Myxococcales bacterium]
MRKARSSKEKAHEAEAEAPEAGDPESASEDVKPRKGRAKARVAEEPERPVRRRVARKDGDEPESDRDRDDERDRADRADQEEDQPAPARPVLTAIPRPVRDDDLQGVGTDQPGAATQLPPPPSTPEAPRLEPVRDGAPMQVIKLNDLKRMKITELSKFAHDLQIENYQGLKKQDLIFAILSGIADKRFEVHAEGVMELLSDGFGFLRSADSDYQPSPDDIYVSPSQVRRFNLRPGDTVTGPIRQPREGERFFALQRVDKTNFVDPLSAEARERILFDNLTPLYPTRKLKLEHEAGEMTTRIIDLFCPIGMGQRCLIVAPPKAGKTVLLQNIAHAVAQNHPEIFLIVLLVDERPEEVTDMERSVRGE